jgi:hypothetical protein
MRVLTTDGMILAHDLSDFDASMAGRFANAVKHYLDTGDSSLLEPFEGLTIAGHTLETRTDRLDWWGLTGEASYESIYEGGV